MAVRETTAIVNETLAQLEHQTPDHLPHIAAVSLWRLHAVGRAVPQHRTYRILSRCLMGLGLEVAIVPMMVRVWDKADSQLLASHGRSRPGERGGSDDWYFVLVVPGLDRLIDAHLPELPEIDGTELADHFLQIPYGALLTEPSVGVDRFDRIIEYRPVDPPFWDVWDREQPDLSDAETHCARRLVGEVAEILRWDGVWKRLDRDRWSVLVDLIERMGEESLLVLQSDRYQVGREAHLAIGFNEMLAAAGSPLAA